MKKKIHFVCVHNSAQPDGRGIHEYAVCPDQFTAESAGLEPGELNPYAVEVMR